MGKWTRRAVLTAGVVGGTALVVGVAIRPGNRNDQLAKYVTDEGEVLVNAWVKIDRDNRVTAIIPHSEMGQGAQTALTQMLADELDAAWDDVSFLEAPAEQGYANYPLGKGYIVGDAPIPGVLQGTVDSVFLQVAKSMHLQITGGSLSVRATGVYGMRVAGAAARSMLIDTAARAWSVPAREIVARDTHLIHEPTGNRAPFAEFAALAGELSPPTQPRLKTRDQFRIMGRPVPRRDLPPKVDGRALFGIDAELPGMKIATIQAAPVFGAQVASVDDGRARSMPGVVDVVRLDDAVAVVADGYWQAKKALAAVQVTWTATDADGVDSDAIQQRFRDAIEAAEADGSYQADRDEGDADRALASAERVVRRRYSVPYLAHACMEPMNALAHVDGERCTLHTGTQNPLGFKYELADALGLDPENVSVTNYFMGGGFGRRSNADAAIQAARISKAAGVPVKLIWSREEDMRHDHYRPGIASSFAAALDADGRPAAWTHTYVDKHEPAEAPLIPYAVANQSIRWVDAPTHVPFGPWRSVDHSQHGFFTESFIDELAWEAGADPYRYRRELLDGKPRHQRVLDEAAQKAGWGEALGPDRGRGISLQESFGTLVAQVVEVSVNDSGVSVDRVVVAVDPGFAVNPDGLKAQMESGVIYGLTAALHGAIDIEDGAAKQGNFDTYPMVRMPDAPRIETHVLESDANWGGAGEPGTPGIGPALTNAIHAATDVRIRDLPVRRALERTLRTRRDATAG